MISVFTEKVERDKLEKFPTFLRISQFVEGSLKYMPLDMQETPLLFR